MSVLNLGLLQLTPGNGLSISGTTLNVNVENSITVDSGTNCLALVGDTATPAASSYWGTNGAGTRGWYLLSSGDVTSISGTSQQIVASASTGAVTLSLATTLVLPGNSLTFLGGSSLTDNGSGALTVQAKSGQSTSLLGGGGTGLVVATGGGATFASTLIASNLTGGTWYPSTHPLAINSTGAGSGINVFRQDASSQPSYVAGDRYFIYATSVAGGLSIGTDGTGTVFGISSAGVVSVPASTTSTSTTTGSLINSGGFGNAGAVWLGADLNLAAGNMATFNGNDSASYAIQGATTGSPFDFRFIADSDTSTIRHFSFGWYTSNSKASSWNEVFNINSHSGLVNLTGTISASSATTGTLTVGNGTAATNVGIGGGNVNAGGSGIFGGSVGIGGSAPTANGLTISSTALTGVGQTGLDVQPVFTSAATTLGEAGYFQVATAAASFTMASAYGINIDNAVLGSGSTITTQVGLNIVNQTRGATNYAIKTGSGVVSIGDTTTSTSASTGAVVIGNGSSGGLGVGGALFVGGIITAPTLTGTSTGLSFNPGGTNQGYVFNLGNSTNSLLIEGGSTVQTNGMITMDNTAATNPTWIRMTSGATVLSTISRPASGPILTIAGGNSGSSISVDYGSSANVTLTPAASGIVSVMGSMTITANLLVNGTITNASDSRLKTDIVDSDLGLSFILGLRPVAYTLRATPGAGRHYGLIAQELAATLGDTKVAAVSVDPSTGHYGIAYSQLIAPLIKGEQELHAEIVALKARVAELEGGLS